MLDDYSAGEIVPVHLSATKTTYMTQDQRYIYDLTNSQWRSATTEASDNPSRFVIVGNEYSSWTTDPYGILLTRDDGSRVYPTNPNTFSISGFGYWTGGITFAPPYNLIYGINSSGELVVLTSTKSQRKTSNAPFSGTNSTADWVDINSNALLDVANRYDNRYSPPMRFWTNDAQAFEIVQDSDNNNVDFIINSSDYTNYADTTFSLNLERGTPTYQSPTGNYAAYPLENASKVDLLLVPLDQDTGDIGVTVLDSGSLDDTLLGSNFALGGITAASNGGSSVDIKAVSKKGDAIFRAAGSFGNTRTSFDLEALLSNEFDYLKNVGAFNALTFSPSLTTVQPNTDALNTNSWVVIPDNTRATAEFQFSHSVTYPTIYETPRLSGSVDIFLTNQDSIVDLQFLEKSIDDGSDIEFKTGYVEIANSAVSEYFEGATVELTGRMMGSGDSLIVYTDVPAKVTIMGIEG